MQANETQNEETTRQRLNEMSEPLLTDAERALCAETKTPPANQLGVRLYAAADPARRLAPNDSAFAMNEEEGRLVADAEAQMVAVFERDWPHYSRLEVFGAMIRRNLAHNARCYTVGQRRAAVPREIFDRELERYTHAAVRVNAETARAREIQNLDARREVRVLTATLDNQAALKAELTETRNLASKSLLALNARIEKVEAPAPIDPVAAERSQAIRREAARAGLHSTVAEDLVQRLSAPDAVEE